MIHALKTSFLFLAVLSISVGLKGCGSIHNSNNKVMFEQNPPFNIGDAYFQKWAAGIEDGGQGINVHLIFENMEPGIKFQELYFRNQVQELEKSLKNPDEYVANFSNHPRKGMLMDIDPVKEAENTPPDNFPFDLAGHETVISYIFRGKNHFYKIPHLSEKENIAYPGANPNGN